MKIVIIADTHAGARNDSPIFNNYFLKFYEKIFFPYLDNHPEIKAIVHLGDVFDRRKYVNFQTLASWRENVFDQLCMYNMPIHIIIGNHDTYFKNTNEINSVQELLNKYDWKYYTEPKTIKIGGFDVCMIPWICDENYEKTLEEIKTTSAQICMGHLELIGFEMFPGQVNVDHGLDANVFQKFDMVFSGHFHHKSHKNNITYMGSPYPMTWSDWGDIRGFHVFDLETRELEFIENPFQIFQKIYYNDEGSDQKSLRLDNLSELTGMFVKVIVQKKTNPNLFDKFIEELHKVNPADVNIIEDVFESLDTEQNIDVAKDTLSIVMDHIEDMGLAQGKEELKQTIRDLYIEALNTNTNDNL